jgi:predicted MFS family arabinose efflux permease
VTEGRLVWTVALHQLVSWGTLYLAFPVFIAPMEAELGWSRSEISGAFTAGLLASGLAAIPAGRWADRHGGRGIMAAGAGIGAALILAWALLDSLALFYAVWIALGVTHAMCLSDPAYAVVTANSRDPRRAITQVTFITGFCTSIFIPLGAVLVEWVGWRAALAAFAALQLVPAVLAAVLLRGVRGSLGPGQGSGLPGGRPLAAALRRRTFWALVVAFCAQAFMGTGLSFHILPLMAERGMPLAAALLVIGVHGPFQVAARALLLVAGPHGRDSRRVGIFAFALLPVAMAVLALAGASLPAMLAYGVLYAVANGLLTIVRATGIADLLGREGYAQISGAITMAMVLPRAVAPLALGLVWEGAGGYAPVPWILFGVVLAGTAAFLVAALGRSPGHAAGG